MPLNAKGEEILSNFKKQYGERGEQVFYASKNAGTISGVDEMENEKPEDCGDQENPRTQSGAEPAPISELPAGMVARELGSRGDVGIMAPQPVMSPIPTPMLSPADGTFGGVVDTGFGRDQTPVMPPVPMPSTQHPQLHPSESAPPEPGLASRPTPPPPLNPGGGADTLGRDAAAGYGGVAGGVIPQEFGDRGLGDALPTEVGLKDICRVNESFWPQWKGTE